MAFCSACGSELGPDARFCPSCGRVAAIGSPTNAAMTIPATPPPPHARS